MYKSVRRQTYPKLLALCKRSVVAVWAGRHLVAGVKSKIKTAVGAAITTFARLFACVYL